MSDSIINSPGSKALKAAKNIKDLTIFKKPIKCVKKKKSGQPKILDEDTYIKQMSQIIQRDFFPHLEKLQAQNQYLDALEQNDINRMRELYAKYSSGHPITERPISPATFETPLHRTESDELLGCSETLSQKTFKPVEKNGETENKTGLDDYLSTHTSEDNASFEEMIIETENKTKLKYAWLYDAEEKSKAWLAIDKPATGILAIEGSNFRPKQVDSWAYKNKNYIMYIPDGVELTTEEKIELAKKKQTVMHENTRLKINPFNEQQNKETINELAKSQSKANDGKIGVDGKEVVKNMTPQINGYNFVTTPTPRPGECESPLMTWGQIEGTPFRLDGGDTPLLRTLQGPSFRIADPPKREQLALQLEKASEKRKDRKNKALEAARKLLATPSPRSTIDRLSTMSPAARRLATQKLRISNTPSPRQTVLCGAPFVSVRTPRTPRTPRMITPLKHTTSQKLETIITRIQGPVLTDNLLNLPPQRQRASDFFNK